MATDKEYLKELMNSITPLVYPDGIPGEEDEFEEFGDEAGDEAELSGEAVPEEEPSNAATEELITEPVEETVPVTEPIEETVPVTEPIEETAPVVESVEEPAPVEMSEDIMEDVVPDTSDAEEQTDVSIDVPKNEGESEPELQEEMLSLEDIDALLSEKGAPEVEMAPLEEAGEEIDLDVNMSAEDIEALLNAAKEVDTPDEVDSNADVKDILSMFSDDAELSDIKDTLEKDDNNQAVDESALETPEVELPNIDGEEEPEDKKKEKKEKKSRKAKKAEQAEGTEGEEGKEPKKGFFAKLFNALTEEVAEEVAKPVSAEEGQTGVTDENAQILNELDAEEGGKKKKKKEKKPKKGKKGKGDDAKEGSNEDEAGDKDEEGGEPEGKGKKKKEKKEKKPKKEKAPKEPEKPGKKLPKKRVRNTVILCLSIFAAIVLLSTLVNEFMNLSKARFAYESADYETAYENLFGLELKDKDQAIYNKSMTIMLLSRKVTSYENYKRLGMEKEALNALIQGIKLYGEIKGEAEVLGVAAQVEDEHTKIINYLAQYGLSEIQAAEIAALDSRVEYNKTLQSLTGTGEAMVLDDVEAEPESEDEGMQDLLKEEQEDLFGTPSQEIQIGYDDEGDDIEDIDADIVPVDEE